MPVSDWLQDVLVAQGDLADEGHAIFTSRYDNSVYSIVYRHSMNHLFVADEQATPEMRDTCAALHQTMVEQDVIAVCGYVKSDQSEPRLAAVIPFSSQTSGQCIGFYLHELPFGDDIRHPERTLDSFGEPTTAMTSSTIALAENIVRLQRVAPEFHPGVAQNPHIRRHAAVLEAMASDTLGDWIVEEGQPLLARNDPVIRDPDLVAAHLRFKQHYSL